MGSSRVFGVLIIVGLAACGGSGGGGGGGGSDEGPPEAPSVRALGWIGRGQEGWHTDPIAGEGLAEIWLTASDVAVDADGNVYVADECRVVKWIPVTK